MPVDESPAQSFARLAAAADGPEPDGPPPPSAEELARRALERALEHLVGLGRYATHQVTCGKDVSPGAVLAGKPVLCSCGLSDRSHHMESRAPPEKGSWAQDKRFP